MAQQTLKTQVVIGGRVDNSFTQIGSNLTALGEQLGQISRQIIDFGKESAQEFVGYDDAMRMVQALGEYSESTMSVLDEYNRTIAQTSKFTAEQAANAEVLMAQLGLDIEQTKTLMPTVMNLATAANISLADSLDYLYYTLNALDKPLTYASTLSDQMAKAAAISAADIDTLGLSMQRLGSGASFFAGGSSELLAILAGISQFGRDMQGAEAGTQLRNFMLTLLAPTQSKQALMQAFSVTDEQWADFENYMEDAGINVTETADAMNALGLSVYDSATGELKPAIQIIAELDAALSSMSESEKSATLGKLFGKRTTITAQNLLSSLETIIEYQKLIENGSAGYTSQMAETLEGGLGGSLRELSAAWNELKITVGDSIAPEIEVVSDFLHGAAVSLSNMDPAVMEGLTTGLGIIAGASTGLTAAGAAMTAIGAVLTPGGIGILSLAALAGVIAYAQKLDEINFENGFGIMELNTEELGAHLQAISDEFNNNYTQINEYADALEAAVRNYETASTTLSSELLTKMITGSTLTEEDIASIHALGESMGDELLAGIGYSFDKSTSYLQMLFGGAENAANNEEYAEAILLAGAMYDDLIGQAEALGREFGETIGSAMDDGIVTGDEYNAIMQKMAEYDEAMAVAARADAAGEMAKQLHRASNVGWDSAEAFLAEQAALMNANVEQADLTHAEERAKWAVYYDEAIRKGLKKPNGEAYTEADRDEFLAGIDAAYQEKLAGYETQNTQVTMAVLDALMGQTDHYDAWKFLTALYTSGDLPRSESGDVAWDAVDWATVYGGTLPLLGEENNPVADALMALWEFEHGSFGMGDRLSKIVAPFANSEQIKLVSQMLDDASMIAKYMYRWDAETGRDELDWLAYTSGMPAFLGALGSGRISAIDERWAMTEGYAQEKFLQVMNNLKQSYDFEKILAEHGGSIALADSEFRDHYAAWQLMYGGINASDYLYGASPTGAAQSAEAAAEEAQGYFRANSATWAVETDVEETIVEDIARAKAVLEQNPGSWQVSVSYRRTPGGGVMGAEMAQLDAFAEGGRATEPSIFGEAGAEWAIPEQHTAETASLIWRAAEASGFSWNDIGEANGVGSRSAVSGSTIIYAPTIVAADASGVDAKLKEDKERFERWIRERELKESISVYAGG